MNKYFKLLIPILFFFNISNAQNEIKDFYLGFGTQNSLSKAYWIIRHIELNEPHKAFNLLPFDTPIEYDNLVDISEQLSRFYKGKNNSYPSSLVKRDTVSCFFFGEKDYYIMQDGEVKYLAQLIVTLDRGLPDDPIVDIELKMKDEFLDRDFEILSFEKNTWRDNLYAFSSPAEAKIKSQDNSKYLTQFDRTLSTLYKNLDYNFGFNYDTSFWKINNKSPFFEKMLAETPKDSDIKFLDFIELLEKEKDNLAFIIVGRQELKYHYSIAQLEKELSPTMMTKEDFIQFGLELDAFKISNSVLDKERKLVVLKSEVSNHLGIDVDVLQSIFIGINNNFILQLMYRKGTSEKSINKYLEMVDTFVLK